MTNAGSATDVSFPDLNLPLDGRYQVKEILSARLWARSYLAQDLHRPSQSECIIHHLKTIPIEPNYANVMRGLFAQEAATLEQLGTHAQIPQLLAWFEDEHGFYAVQEWVNGQPFSQELQPQRIWHDEDVLYFLREVLHPLAWVHQHGGVHGNLHPDNLLRRREDGRLVLIDFSSMGMLQHALMAVHGLFIPDQKAAQDGYQPLEQIQGLACAASDVYALGMIAIAAWTGMKPTDFRVDANNTVEVLWQEYVPPSRSPLQQQLVTILNMMVQWDLPQRYANASEVLAVLPEPIAIAAPVETTFAIRPAIAAPAKSQIAAMSKTLAMKTSAMSNANGANTATDTVATLEPLESPALSEVPDLRDLPGIVEMPLVAAMPNSTTTDVPANQILPLTGGQEPDGQEPDGLPPTNDDSQWSIQSVLASPSVRLGAGGVAVATTVAAVGWSLLNSVDWSAKTGKLWERVASASHDTNRRSIKQLTAQWRNDWQKAATQFGQAETAFKQGEWAQAKQLVVTMPDIPYWRDRSAVFAQQVNQRSQVETTKHLQAAFDYAYGRNFTQAIAELKRIPTGSPVDALAQTKLKEYQEKQNIKAWFDLQQAYNRAIAQDFTQAIAFLYQIPTGTDAYDIAQTKIAEYRSKAKEKNQFNPKLSQSDVTHQLAQAPNVAPPTQIKPDERLDPGSQLREPQSFIVGRATLQVVH